ncbi:MAG: rod shape-determining protein MreC [Gammaproteobacteria bacterium]|nr:rod shape-determining protein MreC [Gammaproteobacteria bacterium]
MSGPSQMAGIPGRSVSVGARFIVLALVALVLMIVDHRQDHLQRVRELLGLAVYPIHVVVDLPFSAWRSASVALTDRQELLRENERLRRQQLNSEYRMQELESLKLENARLRELLESTARLEGRVEVAEILSIDLSYRQRFVINRGSADDVFVGQALLDADGVVGQIASVSPLTAEAVLITDADHAVPVSVLRNGLRTIAVGTGDSGRLRLPYLTNSADIEVGDLLVSSGLGGVFPTGRPVAEVTEVNPQPGQSFAEIVAAPVSKLDRDQEVLLVWTTGPGSTGEREGANGDAAALNLEAAPR